jgi:hypothetical protein
MSVLTHTLPDTLICTILKGADTLNPISLMLRRLFPTNRYELTYFNFIYFEAFGDFHSLFSCQKRYNCVDARVMNFGRPSSFIVEMLSIN